MSLNAFCTSLGLKPASTKISSKLLNIGSVIEERSCSKLIMYSPSKFNRIYYSIFVFVCQVKGGLSLRTREYTETICNDDINLPQLP